MSGSFQPNHNHASYGGHYEITSEEPLPGPSGERQNDYNGPSTGQSVRPLDFRDETENMPRNDVFPQCDTNDEHELGNEFKKRINDPSNIRSRRQPLPIPPDFRVWEQAGKKSDSTDKNCLRFRVVSYNVLAQYLLECHPYLYTECAPENLKWRVRANRLYNEIKDLDPDILCLQEVQASHLNSFYAKFEEIGYRGVFKQKTGHRHDGCAIYYKQSMFYLEDHINVEYFQPGFPILNRDNIGILIKLAPKNSPTSPIVVATTHLLYNPKRTDVRLAQMQVLLAEIDRFAFCNNGQGSTHLPTILTGDFNSTANSPIINLLDKGRVSAYLYRDQSDWRRIGVTDNCQHLSVYLNRKDGGQLDPDSIKIYNSERNAEHLCDANTEVMKNHSYLFNSGKLSHSMNLMSVYRNTKTNGQYEVSTFQNYYWVLVDYIYFSRCSGLRLVERYRLPTDLDCILHINKLPNEVYGSDHLVLAATFELEQLKSSL